MKIKNRKRGFIQIILVVVGALVVLKYVYKVDVVGFLTTGKPKELLDQLYSLAARTWTKYDSSIIDGWDYLIGFGKNLLAKLK